MKLRFFTQIFGALLFLSSISLKAQGFSVYLDSAEVVAGHDFCIAIKSKGFVDLTSYQFSLHWNPQVLNFTETKHYGLPGLSAMDFGNYFNSSYLISGWSHPLGLCMNKMDGDTLFEVCFTAIGAPGNSTLITAGSGGFPPGNGGAEAYNCSNQNIWIITAGSDTGLVKIIPALSSTWIPLENEENTFQIAPNPTHGSTQVWFTQSKPGQNKIQVTDALGRLVFEQKIPVQEGKNRIEIPKEALRTQGIYVVSLLTENGVATQLLSLN